LTVTGRSAKLSALPRADVNNKNDMIIDFMDAGALV
jgi:hypothetical protein